MGAPTHPPGLGSRLWGSLSGGGDVAAAVPLEEVGLPGRVGLPLLGVGASSARLEFPKGGLPVGGQVGPGQQVPPGQARPWGRRASRLRCGLPGRDSAAAHVEPWARRPTRCPGAAIQLRAGAATAPAWCWRSWPGPCGRDSQVTAGPQTRCVQAAPSVDAGLEGVTRRPLRPRQRLRPTRMPLLSGCCDRMVRTGEQSLPGVPAGGRPHSGHL